MGTRGSFLAVTRQSFNLLNIYDEAQLGHLLSDSTAIRILLIRLTSVRHVFHTNTAAAALLSVRLQCLSLSIHSALENVDNI